MKRSIYLSAELIASCLRKGPCTNSRTARGVDMLLIAWDNVTGEYTWDTSVQLAGAWNLDMENPEYTFEDNGTWSDGNQVRAIVLGDFVGQHFQGGVRPSWPI